jgi:hypothetical protein
MWRPTKREGRLSSNSMLHAACCMRRRILNEETKFMNQPGNTIAISIRSQHMPLLAHPLAMMMRPGPQTPFT